MEGKDMTLRDLLSRLKLNNSSPHEIIPVPFDLQQVLQEKILYLHWGWSTKKEELL